MLTKLSSRLLVIKCVHIVCACCMYVISVPTHEALDKHSFCCLANTAVDARQYSLGLRQIF